MKYTKKIEVGDYKFNVSVNREIALKVSEEFPEFITKILDNSNKNNDISSIIKENRLRELFDINDYINENLSKVIKFSLPLLLQEAGEKLNSDKIISYIIENEVDEIFNAKIWEFILSVFTKGGQDKKPKVKFVMN